MELHCQVSYHIQVEVEAALGVCVKAAIGDDAINSKTSTKLYIRMQRQKEIQLQKVKGQFTCILYHIISYQQLETVDK